MDYCNIGIRDVMNIAIQWQKEDYHKRSFLLVTKRDEKEEPFGEIRTAYKEVTRKSIKEMLNHIFVWYPLAEDIARDIIREHDEMENEAKSKFNDTTGTI